MLYCTYDEYLTAGGTVPETAFGVLCSRASRMIDAATFGRAESHAAGCEVCREALADACTQIIGLLAAASAAGAVPGAARRFNRRPRPPGRKPMKSSARSSVLTRTACCTGGFCDADSCYCCEPHPRHCHRDGQAGVLGVRRVQLAGMPLHLRLRYCQPPTSASRPACAPWAICPTPSGRRCLRRKRPSTGP